ncbi:MAG: hypothetical protein O7A71_08235 [Chloroflexi bacterium]|nr:hypothetical protein [Chloroflexota bacterium]
MFGSDVLDVAIGVVVVYLLFALVVSTLNEMIARQLNLRSRHLKAGLAQLLDGDRASPGPLTELMMAHPLTRSLGANPSYMSATTFARVLIDSAADMERREHNLDTAPPITPGDAVAAFAREHPSSPLLGLLRPLAVEAGDDLTQFQQKLEDLFDDQMERVSGWYKRQTQWIMLGLALLVAATFNVDSIQLVESLQTDPSVREALIEVAPEILEAAEAELAAQQANGSSVEGATAISELQKQLSTRTLPFGRWIDANPNVVDPLEFPTNGWGWVYKILGILITGFAISMGAPFWFQALNKLVNLRGSGGKPPTAAEARAANGAGGDAAATTAAVAAAVGAAAALPGAESVRSPGAMTDPADAQLPTDDGPVPEGGSR